MRISIFEVEPWEQDAFTTLLDGHEVAFFQEPLTAANAAAHAEAEAVSTFIYSSLGAAVLDRLPALKLIATRSTGFDHIDLETCRRRGIAVCNVPTYGDNTVAEHVFALLLAISHRMIDAVDRTRRGDFSPRGLQGFDLEGKTLGVVGTGAIGRHVIRIAQGFGMRVLAYDLRPDAALATAMNFRYVELPQLLGESDVVTLHVPGGAATRHMISTREFETMKPGAVLINTARGEVVDSRALLQALASGRLAAAGLDVLEEEPVIREEAELLRSVVSRERDLETLLADSILMRLRNVVVTPHSAFNTREAVGRILETSCANIAAFAAGRPQNLVT